MSKKPLFVSLRYKLALPVLLLTICLVGIIFYTTFIVVDDTVQYHHNDRFQVLADIYTETTKIPLQQSNMVALKQHLRWIADRPTVLAVRVRDSRGTNIAKSGASVFIPKEFDRNIRIYRAIPVRKDVYAISRPIRFDGGTPYLLDIVFTHYGIKDQLKQIFVDRFLLAFVLAFLISLVIAALTWIAIQPLFELQATANKILEGDLSARAEISSFDEIQVLGESFNEMVERLTKSYEDFKERTIQLGTSEKKFRNIVNHSSDIIFSLTPDGDFEFLNKEISGCSKEDVLEEGLPLLFSLLSQRDAERFQQAMEEVSTTQKPKLNIPLTHVHRIHQGEVHYLLNLTPIVEDEEIRFIQGTLRDVTEIQRIQMMKENLVRDVAHELKTPTAKFKMTVNWLENESKKFAEQEKLVPMIAILKRNTDRLSSTIESILYLSKIESGMSEVKKESFDVGEVFRMVYQDMKPFCDEKKLKLEMLSPGEPLEMYGNKDMIYRLFINLVANAIKYTNQGMIQMKIENYEEEICCEVSDTGQGIEEENLQKVFDPFVQKTAASIGIGVGLTISREIVAIHNGEIWAESRGLGFGSSFKVVFPGK